MVCADDDDGDVLVKEDIHPPPRALVYTLGKYEFLYSFISANALRVSAIDRCNRRRTRSFTRELVKFLLFFSAHGEELFRFRSSEIKSSLSGGNGGSRLLGSTIYGGVSSNLLSTGLLLTVRFSFEL